MKPTTPHTALYCLLWILLIAVSPLQAAEEDVLSRNIQLPRSKGTVYQLLGKVTEQSGRLFIYDSKIIDNDRKTSIKAGTYTIREAIYRITGNNALALRTVGNHILIQMPSEAVATSQPALAASASPTHFTMEGTLLDRYTKEPIAYASVGVLEATTGVVTNQNGMFRLRLPDSLRQVVIQFSHIGYQSEDIAAHLLAGQYNQLTLEPKVVSLQEVVIRLVNPFTLLGQMLDRRKEHYTHQPVHLTTFYREGVQSQKGLLNLTEAIFKVYKTSFNSLSSDQVKLLKMRRITNAYEKDTLLAKMKSGIDACLMLDMMKHLPDFLSLGIDNMYTYAHSDIAVVDDRLANVILFEQNERLNLPLYKGEIYIDTESNALLKVNFQINPRHIHQAGKQFVERISRNLSATPREVSYTVSYKKWNGIYYIHHVRGDLHFKIRKKKQLFSNTSLHTWFEMVTCQIDPTNAQRFAREERQPTRTIFSDTHFGYDAEFWENFNVIMPEEKLNEAINKITSKIEETRY